MKIKIFKKANDFMFELKKNSENFLVIFKKIEYG